MAFRKVLAITMCLTAAALAAPAPQTAFLQPAFATAAQPTFLTALPQAIAPAQFSQVRTVVAPQPLVHAVQQQPIVQAVRAIPAAATATTFEEVEEELEVADENPQYRFGYTVDDTLSGDSKTREESRDGDVVTGSYTVADPDGRTRRVTYTADKEHGFQATVTYDGESGPVAIPVNTVSSGISTNTAVVAAEPVANNDEQVQVVDARLVNQKKSKTVVAAAAPVARTVQSFSPALVPQTFAAAQTFAPQQQIVSLRAFPVDNFGFQTLGGARLVQV